MGGRGRHPMLRVVNVVAVDGIGLKRQAKASNSNGEPAARFSSNPAAATA